MYFKDQASRGFSNVPGECTGRSIAAGIYVADPLKSDLASIHLIRPYTSTCRAHTKTAHKPAFPMLLEFAFPQCSVRVTFVRATEGTEPCDKE